MQTLNYIKDTNEIVTIASKIPVPVSRAQHNPTRAYANYRRLQLETALAGNFIRSAQYAELARSVDASQNQRANHDVETN